MPVSAQDVLVASAEVGVDLARQEGILGDVGAARVTVEGEHEQPHDTDDDAEE